MTKLEREEKEARREFRRIRRKLVRILSDLEGLRQSLRFVHDPNAVDKSTLEGDLLKAKDGIECGIGEIRC